MSDSQAYEAITVASDGVSVTKRFEADEFPVPAIAFNVVSKRSQTVNLRLVDTVPDDVAVEDLGFHPEYGSEFWDINDDQITFEKEIEADSDYTTVYGIRATGTDDVEKFLTEPTIESVDPPLDESEEDLVGGDNDAVKDVISGESDSVPGLEDDGDEDIETLNLKDPNSEGAPAADGESAADGDDGDDAAAADGESAPTGNVVAAMANEIRQNNVSAQDVKLLKRALDAVSQDTDPEGGVNTARINRIQNDIADLRAYTDALEEFLAENGTGDEIIEEFDERLDSFEAELDSFEEEIGSAKSAAETATEELESLDAEVDSLGEGLDDVEGTVDGIEGELDDLEAEIEDVREEIGDGELDDRLSDVEDEIVELKEWREQLSSVIGGGE
jgi:predicted  nucleic acid-binding Zn-ribbon protein